MHHRDETVAGIADPWLLLRIGGRVGDVWLAARPGLTLPLGSTEEDPFALGDRGLRHQDIQLGSGTVDPLLVLEASAPIDTFQLRGFVQGTASAPRATAAPTAPRALTTAKVEEPTFALVLSAPDDIEVGAKVRAELSIEGRGEHHVNHEYPIEITLRAPPEVALAATELSSAHAEQLAPERARFELELTCRAPGSHRIDARVDFALCTELACTPETREIALTVRARD